MRGLNLKEIMSKSNMNQQGLNIATYGQAYSTQSPNLVSNSSYFPQVPLCKAPGWDVPVKL